jgi:hypothetical protein
LRRCADRLDEQATLIGCGSLLLHDRASLAVSGPPWPMPGCPRGGLDQAPT